MGIILLRALKGVINMPKRIDLTNQKYGKLTVIEKAANIGDRTAWLCKCDCGNTKIIRTKELRNGIVKSCGCLKSEKSIVQISSATILSFFGADSFPVYTI